MNKLSSMQKVVKAADSNTAMLETKPIRYEDDGDILFATVAKPSAIVMPLVVDEGAFMGMTLDALQAGTIQPMLRLTKAQQDEIEAERVGDHFSQNGWAY